MSEFPKPPETADEMVVRWAERDAEYAKRRVAFDQETVIAIRDARKREVNMLPPADRARMWARANSWLPPVNADFGSMKDWLNG